MRLHLSTPLIALLLIAPLLGGCLERGQPTMVNANGDDDDAFCRANNVKQGSWNISPAARIATSSATTPMRAAIAPSAISANTC